MGYTMNKVLGKLGSTGNRLLVVLLLLAGTFTAEAQTYHRPYRPYHRSSWQEDMYFGVRLGLNSGSLSFSGIDADKSTLTGMNVGVIGGICLTDETPLYFESGLLVTSKGVKVEPSRMADYGQITARLTYLELPLVFKYKIETVIDDFTVEPFFGGFLALGIGGKTKDFTTREKEGSFRRDGFSRLDGGLRLGCGVAYGNFYFDLSYDWGLANVARDNFKYLDYDDFDDKIRTKCLSATLGVNF